MKTSDFTELLYRVCADAHRLNLFSMMAFSVQRSSAGSELACQRSLSSALDRYSVLAMSVRNYMGEDQRVRALRTDRSNAIPTQTRLYLNVGLLQVMRPGGEEVLSHLLVKITSVSHEGGGEETVAGDGGHLVLEGLAGLLPSLPLSR